MNSVGRSLIALPFALAMVWALPTPALASQPDPTAAPAVAPAEGAQPQPVADPTQPAPAPVYQPQPQPMPQPMAQPAPVATPNRNRGLGLMIAGLSIFSISYIISAASGAILIDSGEEEVGRSLLIPIAGPFIAAGRTSSAVAGFGAGFGGIVQLAGVGMAIGGGVMLGTSRRKAQLSLSPGGMQLRF